MPTESSDETLIPFIPDRDDQEYYLSTGLPPFWDKELMKNINQNKELNILEMKTDHPA